MFSRLHSFLTAWTRRERFEDSLDEEVRFHLDAYAEDLVRSGVPGREARRRARIHFGSVEGMKDGCRHVRGLRIADELERLMAHIRLAARMLVKTPIVTSVAVVSLALGIGANAAIFSLYSQFLLRPLPVVEPERLVNLEAPGPKPGSDFCNGAGGCDEVFSYPMFRDLQREQTVFTDVAAHRGFIFSVAWRGRSLNVVEGMQVSGSYFPALGLVPALGRLFGPEIDEPIAGHPVAVVSHEFWQDELGGARNALGEVLLVNGEPLTLVGVAPAGFRGTTVNMPSAIFVPLTMNGRLNRFADEDRFEDRRNYWLYLFARLKPQVSIDQARAAVVPLYRSILTDVEVPLQTDMSDETLARFVAKPLPIEDGRRGQSGMHDSVGAPLLLLLGVTGVVLLIACANIANLLLARSAARASEMAVRLSLGATRRHLVTQLLTESCLLAVLGGAAGLVGAKWTLDFIMGALLPPEIAEFLPLQIDPYAIPFTGAVSLATGLLFGTFPAFHGTRAALVSALKDDAGQPAGARSAAGFRRGLVTAQFALATMLLVVAGLFIQSLRNVSGVELGIRTQDVVTFRLWPGLNGYSDERANALYTRLEAELAAQPGVTATTAASIQVLAGDSWGTDVMVEGFEAGPDTNRSTRFNQVGTDYFRTLGIPLLAGRTFTESDARESPPVALVNEAFARKFNLGRDAVGRRLGRGGLDAELDTEIVGLVADARYSHVKSPAPPLLYVPYRQEDGVGTLAFYARSSLPPEGMLRTIPALVAGVDPTLPVTHLTTLPRQVEESAFEDRTITVLSAAFAGLATLLAAVGLYGVLAYTVAQRTREFGLRMALGADAARLRAMVLRQVGRMTLVGGAVGIVAAVGVGRLAQSLLYEIDGLTPAVAGAAALALAAVALGAGFVPVHRASRVDPMNALRHR